MTPEPTRPVFEFGAFRLEADNHRLLRGGEVVQLAPKAIDTLLLLIEERERVVSKDELVERLWPDTIVEGSNLTQNVYLLRKALGEESHDYTYIETIPKRGYRFVAAVTEKAEDTLVAEEDARANSGSDGRQRSSEVETSPKPRTSLSVAVGLLLVATTSTVIYLWISISSRPKPIEASVAIKSIAVLPFKPIGRGPRDEVLELGMTDTLITKLGNLKQMVVRPTNTVRKYTDLEQDPLAAGREQKVDAVLEGSVQRLGDRIRVTARLLTVRDGTTQWTGQFDEPATDVFALQDSISERVAQAFLVKFTDDERTRLSKRYTSNAEAFRLYLEGRYFWEKRTPEGFQKAVASFQDAIDKDPRYALAYVGLADVYIALPYDIDAPPTEALPKAKAAATHALEIDDTLAEAHAALGFVSATYDWDWRGAESEFIRALELSPNSATAHQRYANYLVVMGRRPQALQETSRALELNPVSLAMNALAGRSYYFTRQYDRTLEQCHKTLDLDANFWIAHFFAAKAYVAKGMYPEAIGELRKVADATTEALATIGYVDAASGNTAEARTILDQLKRRRSQAYVPPSHLAKIYAALGENDQAFIWLDTALQERDSWLIWLSSEPMWDSLRSDPRFTGLLRRLGLPS